MAFKQRKLFTFNAFIALSVVLIIIAKCIVLSKITFGLDDSQSDLKQVSNLIPLDRQVGFYTNDDHVSDIFWSCKYVLAPRVLFFQTKKDTLLVINDNNSKNAAISFPGYTTIYQNKTSNLNILLLAKAQ